MPASLTDRSTTLDRMKKSGVPAETVALFADAYREIRQVEMAKHPVFSELRRITKAFAKVHAIAEGRINTAPELAVYLAARNRWHAARTVIENDRSAEIESCNDALRRLFSSQETIEALRKLANDVYADPDHASKLQIRRKLKSRADFIEQRADGDWNKGVLRKSQRHIFAR